MEVVVDVEGVAEIVGALGRLPTRLENKVLRQAARKAARVMLADAKANVPVDTGALKRGMKIRSVKRGRGSIAVRVATPTREELAKLYPERAQEMLNSQWYFPAAVEYGYTRRGVTKPPAGYMRKAMHENVEKVKAAMRAELLRGLERETALLRAKGVALP